VDARYGLLIHYGLYSLLGRGEWVLNREQIPIDEYQRLMAQFTADKFNAAEICDLAVRAGMRYIVIITMHHDGFCLYETDLTDFNSTKAPANRDLVMELIDAARKRNLRIGLYHSLNNWIEQPDAVKALENPSDYEIYIEKTHARVKELVTRFNPIDVLWYDGWWPFDAVGWKAQEMNQMVRKIQPHILFNPRNGLPGDFATPEGHVTAPTPWRPWEACMPMNNNWGYHRGDNHWKSPCDVIDMLATVAAKQGNLLLNIGPRGDGSIPDESSSVLKQVGDWIQRCGECIFDTDYFTFDLRDRGDHRADWSYHGPFTSKGKSLYLLLRNWPGNNATLAGFECEVKKVTLLGFNTSLKFTQSKGRIVIKRLPDQSPDPLRTVIRMDCDRPPSMYLCGGMRVPRVNHPHYDPCPSDILN